MFDFLLKIELYIIIYTIVGTLVLLFSCVFDIFPFMLDFCISISVCFSGLLAIYTQLAYPKPFRRDNDDL